MQEAWSNRIHFASILIIALGLLNFLTFVAISLYLGGDAVNGKVEQGHFHLWGYGLRSGVKGYKEVTEGVFSYSRWHVYSIFATWPLVMAAGYLENRKKGARTRAEGK